MTTAEPRPPSALLSDGKKLDSLRHTSSCLLLTQTTFIAAFRPVGGMEVTMDPLFLAWSYLRRRKLQQCSDICTKILHDNPYDQVLHCAVLWLA